MVENAVWVIRSNSASSGTGDMWEKKKRHCPNASDGILKVMHNSHYYQIPFIINVNYNNNVIKMIMLYIIYIYNYNY